MHDSTMKIRNAVVDVTLGRSEVDGAVVLWIDTPDIAMNARGPMMRVYLNDESIYENPVFHEKKRGA